jgi:hypothetical protein
MLSFASVHKFALHEGCRPSVLSFASVHKLRYEGRVRPPCYHSHLFINLRYTKGPLRPSCYHSHLFINLRYGCRVPPCYHSHLFIICVTRRGVVLVLSFASVRQICVTRKGPLRPSVLSFASVHNCVYEGHVPSLRAIIHVRAGMRAFWVHPSCYSQSVHVTLRPSVLSFASVHKFALHEGARPSVLSFASVHKFAFYERRYVPPCYHSHLFISCVKGAVRLLLSFICS